MTRCEPSRNERWKGYSSLSSHLQPLEGKGPQTCSEFLVYADLAPPPVPWTLGVYLTQ